MPSPHNRYHSGPQTDRWLIGVAVFAALPMVVIIAILGGVRAGWPAGGQTANRPGLTEKADSRLVPTERDPGPASGASHLPPGEPGVLDVQAWDWLWQDLERLLTKTDRNARVRLGPDTFRQQFIGVTIEFLKLDGEAVERFQAQVDRALANIADARADMEAARPNMNDGPDWMADRAVLWDAFRQAQRAAVYQLRDALDDQGRHRLLHEQALKWLLRLDYGIRAATR